LKKSFSEIQHEEENRILKEDRMCRIDGNQWFVQQRERAASIGEIAEQEKKNREMQELIEQQRQIEQAEEEQLAEAIARSLAEQGAKKQQKKKRQGRQKKSTKSNAKTVRHDSK
jgi:peptidoglycan hydrolase CwlO-like protein